MSFFRGAAAYGRLLRSPSARQAVTASSVCRLSYGTLVLALLLVVEHATRSFAVAGAASGVFSISTLSGPAKARFIGDRHRRWRVVSLSALYAGSLVGLASLASARADGALPFLVFSATAGLATPPVGAMMRARWASITTPADRQRAFALDVALEDGLFFVGPLLAGGLIALGGPELAMWVTAALFVGGIGLLVLAPVPVAVSCETDAASRVRGPSKGLLHPLSSADVRAVLLVLLGVSAGTGVIDVAVAARAVQDANTAAAGYVLAATALGSVVGGLIWGHSTHQLGLNWQLVALGGVVVATLALSAVTDNLILLAAVLIVNGAALSPLLVLVYLIVDQLAAGGDRTLVSTWANTTFNAGVAIGAAVGGAVVASLGPTSAFLVGAGIAAVGVMLAIPARRLLAPQPSPTGEDRP